MYDGFFLDFESSDTEGLRINAEIRQHLRERHPGTRDFRFFVGAKPAVNVSVSASVHRWCDKPASGEPRFKLPSDSRANRGEFRDRLCQPKALNPSCRKLNQSTNYP